MAVQPQQPSIVAGSIVVIEPNYATLSPNGTALTLLFSDFHYHRTAGAQVPAASSFRRRWRMRLNRKQRTSVFQCEVRGFKTASDKVNAQLVIKVGNHSEKIPFASGTASDEHDEVYTQARFTAGGATSAFPLEVELIVDDHSDGAEDVLVTLDSLDFSLEK